MPPLRLTTEGLARYARACLPGYDTLLKSVGAAIANEDIASNEDLAAKLGQGRLLVDHALEVLEGQGLITVARYGGGLQEVAGTSPKLRRWLST